MSPGRPQTLSAFMLFSIDKANKIKDKVKQFHFM